MKSQLLEKEGMLKSCWDNVKYIYFQSLTMILSYEWCIRTDFGIVNCTNKNYHITISIKPYIRGKARFGPELDDLLSVFSPVTGLRFSINKCSNM